jgi:salicylate hydroxylase
MLVAADGRYSALRAFTVGAPRPTIPGIGTWRLLVRDAKESPIDDYGQYFQNNARLLSFALPGGDVYVAGSFPLDGDGPMPEAARTAQAQRRLFTPAGSPPSPAVEWMLSMIDLHLGEVNWARTQEIEPLHQALDGRLLLLGDAAHAMFQTLGQGATQSIEDALAAADLLRSGIRDPAELSKAYEARRSARVAFAKRFTQEATDTLLPGVDPVAGALAKAQPPFLSKLRQLYCDVS